MKSFKAIFGLTLCAFAASATPVTSLTAGLFTFTNITCSSLVASNCAGVTWSASTQSTSENGGSSSITFSDNGGVGSLPPGYFQGDVTLTYDVTYSGVDPHGYPTVAYALTFAETPTFLGGHVSGNDSLCTSFNGCYGGEAGAPPIGPPMGVTGYLRSSVYPFNAFDAVEDILFLQPAGPTYPGSFTTTYTAADSPEPSTVLLVSAAFLLMIIHEVRRSGCVERRRRRVSAVGGLHG